MAHFQIRTPRQTNLHQMIQDLSNAGWQVIQEDFSSERVGNSQKRTLFEQINQSLGVYMTTFDLCGTVAMCADEVEGGPWLDYDENIYVLNVPSVDKFIDDLAFSALTAVDEYLKPGKRRIVFQKLRTSFNKCLRGFLFFNPVCRRSEFCKLSSPVNPWRQ